MGVSGATPGDFLPLTTQDLAPSKRHEIDVVLVTGDAYVDHPAFGVSLIGRVLEAAGFQVAIISRPDWRSPEHFRRFGPPRLCFAITAGNLDSQVANRNAWKHPRKKDSYAPGGLPGGRPDRAALVYAQRCREAFPGVPLILGGLEASLRRLAHYDWWSDKVRRSLILDARADLLIYGMGEMAVIEAVQRLAAGRDLAGIPGTALAMAVADAPAGREIPDFEAVRSDKSAFLAAQRALEEENRVGGKILLQGGGSPGRLVVQYPPGSPATPADMDRWYGLPFTRASHPHYQKAGGVPALDLVRDSVTSHRGCLGDCSFCGLTLHQGRWIASRSAGSIAAEVKAILADPVAKGRISDVGGPSANMFGLSCPRLAKGEPCRDRSCLVPKPCPSLQPAGSRAWVELLQGLERLPGLRRLQVGSGPRFDLLDPDSLKRICEFNVAGQLKVAPEHCGAETLRHMNKPAWPAYDKFRHQFRETNRLLAKDQYLSNYFLVAHPGTSLTEAVELFDRLSGWGYSPEQVQAFMPIPMTRAAAMYWTERDMQGREEIPVAKGDHERRMHLALAQWKIPAHHNLIREALKLTRRQDLVGRLGRGRSR